MKKTIYNSESWYSRLTIPKSFGRIFALAFILSAFTFTSCSDESVEMDSSSVTEEVDLNLTLTPKLGEFIHLVGKSGDTENLAFKGRATSAAGNDRGRFNITLKFVEPPTDRQREVFEAAAARWERIIIKDVPSFTPTEEGGGPLPSSFGEEPLVDVGETLDDIIIEVSLAFIDGPGMILGRAGPRFVRTDDFLTLSGLMEFDTADLDFLDELDLFEEVIVHEMGHVLGVGTLWNVEPYFPRTLLEGTIENPYFSGKMANVHWNAEGGTGELPVEGLPFRPGTSFSHWDEDVLDNELMTGFLNLGENPLSRITAGSLRDLGYGTAVKGESYDLPKGTSGIDVSASGSGGNEQGLNIAEMEELLLPIGIVTIEK